MNRNQSAMVYYPRRKVFGWLIAVAAILTTIFGAIMVATGNRQAKEIAFLQKQTNKLAAQSAKLRLSNEDLKKQAARLRLQVRAASRRGTPSGPPPAGPPVPEVLVKERVFPPGEAMEVLPGRLFVTLSRLDGERARIRVADVMEGKSSNRNRVLEPGQTWNFKTGKESFALLFHSLKGYPPAARFSIRKLPKEN